MLGSACARDSASGHISIYKKTPSLNDGIYSFSTAFDTISSRFL